MVWKALPTLPVNNYNLNCHWKWYTVILVRCRGVSQWNVPRIQNNSTSQFHKHQINSLCSRTNREILNNYIFSIIICSACLRIRRWDESLHTCHACWTPQIRYDLHMDMNMFIIFVIISHDKPRERITCSVRIAFCIANILRTYSIVVELAFVGVIVDNNSHMPNMCVCSAVCGCSDDAATLRLSNTMLEKQWNAHTAITITTSVCEPLQSVSHHRRRQPSDGRPILVVRLHLLSEMVLWDAACGKRVANMPDSGISMIEWWTITQHALRMAFPLNGNVHTSNTRE